MERPAANLIVLVAVVAIAVAVVAVKKTILEVMIASNRSS